jgi:hypothetical protein
LILAGPAASWDDGGYLRLMSKDFEATIFFWCRYYSWDVDLSMTIKKQLAVNFFINQNKSEVKPVDTISWRNQSLR